MTKTFKNRPNEVVDAKYKDGTTKKIWVSRSPAVVGAIFGKYNDTTYVLTEKRSNTMEDEKGKWAIVSGYLDWDETGVEGIIRETYEETSFYIPDYDKVLVFDNDGQPVYVHTDPSTDAKQNVSLTYMYVFDFDRYDTLPLPMDVENYKDTEVDEVKWMKLSEYNLQSKDWAFRHDERLRYLRKNFYHLIS